MQRVVTIFGMALLATVALPSLGTGLLYLDRAKRLREHPEWRESNPLTLLAALVAFVRECTHATTLTWTSMIDRSSTLRRAAASTEPVAVILPDFGLHSYAYRKLARRLAAIGLPTTLCKYDTWHGNLESSTAQLEQLLAQPELAGAHVVLIGHGIGGLVARHYLRRRPARNVRRLITLGTPHQGGGTPLFRLAPLQQFQTGSAVMAKLAAGDHLPRQFDVTAICSDFDAISFPPATADYPGAFNIEVRGVGHYSMLASARVFGLIAENLGAAQPR